MARNGARIQQPSQDVVQSAKIGNTHDQIAAGTNKVDMPIDDALNIGKVFDKTPGNHDVELSFILASKVFREEVGVNNVGRIESVLAEYAFVQLDAGFRVLDPVWDAPVLLVQFDQKDSRGAADFKDLRAPRRIEVARENGIPQKVVVVGSQPLHHGLARRTFYGLHRLF